jgi:FdhD protein
MPAPARSARRRSPTTPRTADTVRDRPVGITVPARGPTRRKAVALPVRKAGAAGPVEDLVAVEEPLEIRLAGETVSVTMRTPGDDHRLALGYLFGEGILRRAEDASTISHCGRPGDPGYGNVIDVAPASGALIDWDRLDTSRRAGITSSACGVCGRSAVDDLLAGIVPLPPGPPITAATVAAAVARLRTGQPTFQATGGTHAAALTDLAGELLAVHEDVGRHNAVDKVVGALLLQRATGQAPVPAVLSMSGRGGFEIVQKAARAGVPVVACVSAPTTLAVAVAEAAGVTLCAFVRGARMNVYAHASRLTGLEAAPEGISPGGAAPQ